MAMEQGRVTEFEGKSLDQIQIEPEGRAVEILSQTDGLKETSSGEPSTIHPDAPHGSGSAPSERCPLCAGLLGAEHLSRQLFLCSQHFTSGACVKSPRAAGSNNLGFT
uniref:Uncharacterized protein n=1 Tax=Knipowitschia caucasica TaxID=637954 RepID=A0AAV2MTU7_KNICA